MGNTLIKIKNFVGKETVLTVSFFCAVISMFFVKPSVQYFDYIDYRTLGLLFCLMASVQGMKEGGLIERASNLMVKQRKLVCLMLIIVPFFAAMIITNDVVLIAFVPFAIMTLNKMNLNRAIIPVVVFQTIAANLGSSGTVIGNPQNLYIYSHYQVGMGEFTKVILPVVIIGFAVCAGAAVFLSVKYYKGSEEAAVTTESCRINPLMTVVSLISLVFAILTVFSVVSWQVTLGVTVVLFIVGGRKALTKVDYFLLLTFVCFFIFSGNIRNIEAVRELFTGFMNKSEFLTSLLSSQVISNVPSAVLLSGFTENWKPLLLGVDVGGLGTPVASLASLISFKLYSKSDNSNPGRYMLFFVASNAVILVILVFWILLFNLA